MIVLAIWNCCFIPFDIAFDPLIADNAGMIVLDYLIDILFVIDIVINFRTTYINSKGEEVYDPKEIRNKYMLGGRFWIDILSVIPFEEMSGN